MEPFDYKEAIKVMEGWGYTHTADNHAKTVLFFLKTFEEKKLHLHATVTLSAHLIDLDTIGNLDLGITLYCDSIDIGNVKFPEFEKRLFNYLYLCIYGKPFCSVEDDTNNGLYFKPEPKGQTNGGGKPIGGDEQGKGKPSTKPSIKERKLKFWEEVKHIAKQKGYPKELAVAFYTYWSEMNKSQTSFRREKENFFNIPKRFATWIKNDKNWSNKAFTVKSTEVQEEEVKEHKQKH